MARFGSEAWIGELDAAARAGGDALREATAGVQLAITQLVSDDEKDCGPWTLVIEDGSAQVVPGSPADDAGIPSVRFTMDRETAVAVARGDLAPQDALAGGRLRVGGDLDALRRHRAALAAIDDVFAEVRARTDWS